MRNKQVTYKQVDLLALVNTLDPTRTTRPVKVYDGRKPIFERPLQPEQEYPWVKK